ncbi:uncharacterized protein F4812DRAFT_462954 [Daldinia caldariorum]|uniref:uncharacterized protein n=1 Tax=Daldinia caldariorum TaxID=326644 RepID=UPI002007CC78|nr:uncharacterized protein F4812DRAFT_462954 [Daldinia caldariorum]KAI1464204.1 hypothetical protein F4812DRAFT_462954 [Daldinia caldariorum]
MADFNQALAGGAHFVARAIEYQVRQATSSTSPTPSADSTFSTFTSTPTTLTPSAASPPPTAEPSAGGSNNGDNNGGQSTNSPLLFFVALGFGVVFTNLWIIVGVKYCFRYNARNRQLRGLDENGEPINLENMPARPHRRRREKKLMTMDEVNDKFPMMKYKAWVLARANEGLPTTGGVSAPPSRANSVRSIEGIVPEISSKEQDSNDDHADPSVVPKSTNRERSHSAHDSQDTTTDGNVTSDNALTHAQTAESIIMKEHDHRGSMDDDDEDDEHIDAALPPELVGTQGDTCAICIDTLEDNDDIRGLTCGHAFHAVCIDPWLTNRRASCPLCKADYYTPKPRAPPADGDPANPTSPNADPSRNNGRMNMPRSPQRTFTSWSNFRGTPRGMIAGRFGGVGTDSASYNRHPRIWERNRSEHPRHRHHHRNFQPEPQLPATESAGIFSRVRGHFLPLRLNGLMRRDPNGQAPDASGVSASGANGGANTTPSQLEAGVRPPANAVN